MQLVVRIQSIIFVSDDLQPQILSPEDSALWREAYLQAFVDTTGERYQQDIATLRKFSDGLHYNAYLWDCLRADRITVQRFRHEVLRHPEVFVIADNHSRERVVTPPLWPYPPYSVACFKPQFLLDSLDWLPEDIYVFDSSLTWTVVLTHEDDGKRRFCLAVGIED
jgi:hypothetical protein